jgi:SAM-dependent methyltransferase
MSDGTKDYRSRFYQQYLTTQVQSDIKRIQQDLEHRAPYLKRLIRNWIPEERNTKILDLGCGYGALLYFLKQAGYHSIKGIDGSPEQVAVARALGLDFVQAGDVLDILRKSDYVSYDVVIAFDVLEHFTKQEILTITDELYRVLRSGGRLILHVPNGEAIFSGNVYFGDLTHETGFTRQSIRQLMSCSGFSKVHFAEDVPVVHGIKSGLRYVVWKVIRSLFRLIYMAETGDWGRDIVLTQNLMAVIEKE